MYTPTYSELDQHPTHAPQTKNSRINLKPDLQDANDMAQAITARCPAKIDIGPVYMCNPQDRLKFGGAHSNSTCNTSLQCICVAPNQP